MASQIIPLSFVSDLFVIIKNNFVANLPFILALVGFGIVFNLVLHKIKNPFSSGYDGNYGRSLSRIKQKGYTKKWSDDDWDMWESDHRSNGGT